MKKPIPPLDLLFYIMETHDNPKHVGGLQIFQMPPDAADDYMVSLVDKLRRIPVVEPFNFKPEFSRTSLPQWQSDAKMEMEYHLRHSALPKPGNMRQLLEVVQRLHTGILDRERPGWICQVIEGLEGNRFAIYSKIHHAYIDGMSAVRRIYGALSTDPDSQELAGIWSFQTHPTGDSAAKKKKGLVGSAKNAGRAAVTQARAIGEMNAQIARVVMELVKLRPHTGRIPFRAPRTRINDPVESDLRSMGVTTLPLDQLKEIGKLAGCTLNDVVLTITDAALHDYLAKHNDNSDQPLVAMCPMSVREAGDEDANTQVATLLVELGEPGARPRERLQQVAQSASGAKTEAREMSREGLMDFVLFVGGAFELMQRTGLERIVPQSYNVLLSNVPGPSTRDLYMLGSRMEAIYPLTTLTPGNNLNVTVLSHGDSLDVGMLAARGTLPDIEYLVARMDHQFEALAREFGVGAKPKASSKTKTKTRARPKTANKAKTRGKPKARAKAKRAAKPLSGVR